VPRLRAPEIWRVEDALLEQAQDDAHAACDPRHGERGHRHHHDGECAAKAISNRFATSTRRSRPAQSRHDHQPQRRARHGARIRGPIVRSRPIEVRDVQSCARHRPRDQDTLPAVHHGAAGADDYYKEKRPSPRYADAVNAEARDLKAAGADLIQLDEPWLQARPERRRRYGVKRSTRARRAIPAHGRAPVLRLCRRGWHDKPSGTRSWRARRHERGADLDRGRAPRLDLGVLKDLAPKTVVLGVIRPRHRAEWRARGSRAPPPRRPRACAARALWPRRLRHEVPSREAAFGK